MNAVPSIAGVPARHARHSLTAPADRTIQRLDVALAQPSNRQREPAVAASGR
jgi:hypothetical protein